MRSIKMLRLYLILATLESLASLVFLFAIPGDSKNALIFGFSAARLALGIFLLIIFCGFVFLTRRSLSPEDFASQILNRLRALPQNKFVFQLTVGVTIATVLFGLGFFFILTNSIDDPFHSYKVRLSPLVLLTALLSFQTLLFLPKLSFPHWEDFKSDDKIFFASLLTLSVILSFAGVMTLTGIGIHPPRNSWGYGWSDPAVPILTGQGLATFGWGLAFLVGFAWLQPLFKKLRVSLSSFDLILCFVIWGTTAALWTNQPFTTNWFVPAPLPPNYERYPYSDAFIHDVVSQHVLIGEGLKWADHQVPRRPLYGLFLAGLHLLAGQDYDGVVQWQVLGLALFPVGIYLLGAKLHHRATGIVGAAIIILRERNAIELSDIINVSHVKLMMSDLPTALLVCGFTLLCVLWLQNPARYRNWPWIIGAVLGVTMLIRTQSVLLVGVPLLASLPVSLQRGSGLHWGKSAIMLIAGLFLVISPWLWRNWQITGGLAFDETNSQIGMIARRLSISPEDFDDTLRSGESEAQYTSRMTRLAGEYILQHPSEAAYFILSNFFHSQFSTIISLPTSALGETAEEFIRRTEYWFKWEGPLKPETVFPMIVNLCLIAMGLGTLWTNHKWIGLVPLGVYLVYSLSNALATISGWRFMLPADWVGIFIFSVGFVQVSLYLAKVITVKSPEREQSEKPLEKPLGQIVFTTSLIGLVLIGMSLPLVEFLVPPRFAHLPKTQTLDLLSMKEIWQPIPENIKLRLENALEQTESVVYIGRGFYPRFFASGQGELGTAWPAFEPRSCNRLSIFLVGPIDAEILLPLEHPPEVFPNAMDIVVIGYPVDNLVEAVAVIPLDPSIPALASASEGQHGCSPIEQ